MNRKKSDARMGKEPEHSKRPPHPARTLSTPRFIQSRLRRKRTGASDLEKNDKDTPLGLIRKQKAWILNEGVPMRVPVSEKDCFDSYEPSILEIAYSQWENDKNGKLRAKLVERNPDSEVSSFQWVHFESKDPATTAKFITSIKATGLQHSEDIENKRVRFKGPKENIIPNEENFLFKRLKENLNIVQDRQYQSLTQGGAWDIRTWYEDSIGIPHYAKTSCIPFHSRSFKPEIKTSPSTSSVVQKHRKFRDMYGPKQAEKKNTAIVAFCSKSVLVTIAPSSQAEIMGNIIVVEPPIVAPDPSADGEKGKNVVDRNNTWVIRVMTEHGQSYIFPFEHCKTWFTLLSFIRFSCFRNRQVNIEGCMFYSRTESRTRIQASNWFQNMSFEKRIALDLDMLELKSSVPEYVPTTIFDTKPNMYELPPKHRSNRLIRALKRYQNMLFFLGTTREASTEARSRRRQSGKGPNMLFTEPISLEPEAMLNNPSQLGGKAESDPYPNYHYMQLQLQSFAAELAKNMAQELADKLIQAQASTTDIANASGHTDTKLDTTNGYFDWVGSFGRVEYAEPLDCDHARRPRSPEAAVMKNQPSSSNLLSHTEYGQKNTDKQSWQPILSWPIGYAKARNQNKRYSTVDPRFSRFSDLNCSDYEVGHFTLADVSKHLDSLISNLLDPNFLKAQDLPKPADTKDIEKLLAYKRVQLASIQSKEQRELITVCESLGFLNSRT